jgi:hypothetical protein
MWHNLEEYGRLRQATDNIIRHMRITCWITKATDTYSEYVMLIAFPRQQWLLERAAMLRTVPIWFSVKPSGTQNCHRTLNCYWQQQQIH